MNKRVEKTIINPPDIDCTRTLKPATQLLDADPMWAYLVRLNPNGQYSPTQFEDIYSQAEQAKLALYVPAEIREHFATALNLVAYSWFYYPFATQAEFAAYTTVEKALKLRFGYSMGKAPKFSVLLTRAITDKLLTEVGFPHMAGLPPVQPIDGKPTTRLELVKRMMLNARNTMAHGDPRLHPIGPSLVIVCAELINQLFGNAASGSKKGGS